MAMQQLTMNAKLMQNPPNFIPKYPAGYMVFRDQQGMRRGLCHIPKIS